MVKNNRGVIGIALALIVVCILIGGGYLYVQNRQDNTLETTPTPSKPTPIPTIVMPPATVISSVPTPSNPRDWQISKRPHDKYEFTFKYPPNWSEHANLKSFAYYPSALTIEDYSMNFFYVFEADRSVEEVLGGGSVGQANYPVIKREKFEVNGREFEMVVSNELKDGKVSMVRITTFIKGIDFNDYIHQSTDTNKFENPDGCYENGMLQIDAIYNNPPAFTLDNIPYENDIKQMLTTFEFSECVPVN